MVPVVQVMQIAQLRRTIPGIPQPRLDLEAFAAGTGSIVSPRRIPRQGQAQLLSHDSFSNVRHDALRPTDATLSQHRADLIPQPQQVIIRVAIRTLRKRNSRPLVDGM